MLLYLYRLLRLYRAFEPREKKSNLYRIIKTLKFSDDKEIIILVCVTNPCCYSGCTYVSRNTDNKKKKERTPEKNNMKIAELHLMVAGGLGGGEKWCPASAIVITVIGIERLLLLST